MKQAIIDLLIRLAQKLSGDGVFISRVDPDVLKLAEGGVKLWLNRGASGEFRRHQVLAKMLKDKPGLRQRDASLAIEYALRRVSP